MKIYTYHASHSYTTSEGKEVQFYTQLYNIGIYGIVNNDPGMQAGFEPLDIVKIEKRLNKEFSEGTIKGLKFGREIKVSDASGFWEEVL